MATAEAALHVCGARGSYPPIGAGFGEFGYNTTCFVLRRGNKGVVIDCGTGFRAAQALLSGCEQIEVLLTHFHIDHILGLLLFPWLAEGAKKAKVYYPEHYGDVSSILSSFPNRNYWPVNINTNNMEFVPVCERGRFNVAGDIGVCAHKSVHPGGCLIYRFDMAKTRLSFVFDYEHGFKSIDDFVENSDYLMYDGMYDDLSYPLRKGWGHSTWQEGTALAHRVHAKNLIIIHHDPESDDGMLTGREQAAAAVFPKCRFAREGDIYTL